MKIEYLKKRIEKEEEGNLEVEEWNEKKGKKACNRGKKKGNKKGNEELHEELHFKAWNSEWERKMQDASLLLEGRKWGNVENMKKGGNESHEYWRFEWEFFQRRKRIERFENGK